MITQHDPSLETEIKVKNKKTTVKSYIFELVQYGYTDWEIRRKLSAALRIRTEETYELYQQYRERE